MIITRSRWAGLVNYMADGVYLVCLLVVVAATSLEPCSGLPVDGRDQALKRWEKESRERGGSSNDICLLCEVNLHDPAALASPEGPSVNHSIPQGAVDILKTYLEKNTSIEKLYPVVEPMCLYFMEKVHSGYNGPYMCPGIINSYGPVVSNTSLQLAAKHLSSPNVLSLLHCKVLYVFAEGALNPSDLCYLLHLCNETSSSRPHLSQLPFLSDVMLDSPLLTAADVERDVHSVESEREMETFLRGRRKSSGGKEKKDNNTIVFLHLSDIHLDRQYSEVGATSIWTPDFNHTHDSQRASL